MEPVATSESLPGLTPEPPPQNEPQENVPAIENSRFEKLVNATKGVFESAGVRFQRRGGRPRKDGKPNKLDVPINAPPTALPAFVAPPPAPPVSGLDSALVKKCCSAVIKAFKGFADKILHRKAIAAGWQPREISDLVTETTITQEEAEAFSELAEICLKKYGVGTEWCPEIGLGAIVLGVGARYMTAFRTLDRDATAPAQNGKQ